MPSYEWECENCDYKELKNFSISKVPKVRTCPHCGEHALYKLIGKGSTFDLKGTGWYYPGIQ